MDATDMFMNEADPVTPEMKIDRIMEVVKENFKRRFANPAFVFVSRVAGAYGGKTTADDLIDTGFDHARWVLKTSDAMPKKKGYVVELSYSPVQVKEYFFKDQLRFAVDKALDDLRLTTRRSEQTLEFSSVIKEVLFAEYVASLMKLVDINSGAKLSYVKTSTVSRLTEKNKGLLRQLTARINSGVAGSYEADADMDRLSLYRESDETE